LKVKLLLLFPVFMFSFNGWHYNLYEAEKAAKENHKYILLNFSGSDWCGPCIRMRNEIFETEVFRKMADAELVLVNADFPRKKKHQPSPEQRKINDEMADKYNPLGKFPYTLLLNSEGGVLKAWEGLPDESAEEFTLDIRNDIYSNQAGR
jgi:thioredoxin-related protein